MLEVLADQTSLVEKERGAVFEDSQPDVIADVILRLSMKSEQFNSDSMSKTYDICLLRLRFRDTLWFFTIIFPLSLGRALIVIFSFTLSRK